MFRRAIQWASAYRRQITFVYAAALVVLISFALGYIAGKDFTHAPIVIETCAQ